MRYNLNDYVLFWPGVVVAIAVAVLASGRVLRRSRPLAFGLACSVGIIVAATLTPGRDALLFGIPGSGSCDLSDVGLPTISDLRTFNDTSLNVLLFVPFGVAVGYVATSRRTLLAAAVAFPIGIEVIQLIVTPLGRSCQSVDVVDNLTGLVIGLAIAGLSGVLARLVRDRDVTTGDHSERRA